MTCYFVFRYFTNVEQKFLVTGHTFLPCDRLFALIEKKKKHCTAYIPDQWIEVILSARPSKPFLIQRMYRESFLSFSALLQNLPRPNTFKVTHYCKILLSKESPSEVLTTTTHNTEENAAMHNFVQPFWTGRNPPSWSFRFFRENIVFPIKYEQPIPISDKKFIDLGKMCLYLRDEYKAYYRNLPHSVDLETQL